MSSNSGHNHPTQKELYDALQAAFPDKGSLTRMVFFHLKQNLDAIASDGNLSDTIFDLIRWVEAHGRLPDLIQGAAAENPGNPLLQSIVERLNLPTAVEPTPDAAVDNAVQTGANPTTLEAPLGTMSPASPFYIARPADAQCRQIISGGNPFTLYVQAPRQMGKSALMQRILHESQEANASLNVAYVDFEKFSGAQLDNMDTFLISLCVMLGGCFDILEKIDDYWSSKYLSPLSKCSDYVFDYLVPQLNGPVIFAMDEVEKVLGLPFQDDFFGMLRTWHNDRAREAAYARGSLFLSSSTEPELFIENPNQSPFNVAQLLELTYFDRAAVERLNTLHGAPLSEAQMGQLHIWLNGHPYLTRQALYTLATTKVGYDQLVTQATGDDSPFKMHLQNLWRHLEQMPELRAAMAQILRHGKHPLDRLYYRLKGAGLVMRDGDNVRMANRLYADYFARLI